MIVAQSRGLSTELDQPISGLRFEIVSVTLPSARRVAETYATWGEERLSHIAQFWRLFRL